MLRLDLLVPSRSLFGVRDTRYRFPVDIRVVGGPMLVCRALSLLPAIPVVRIVSVLGLNRALW